MLREAELGAGDFVRWTRQLLDLLDQIATAADGQLRAAAVTAGELLRRGVVAYSTVA